jgi:hypothetical protein
MAAAAPAGGAGGNDAEMEEARSIICQRLKNHGDTLGKPVNPAQLGAAPLEKVGGVYIM